MGQWWPAGELGALRVAVHAWDLSKEVAITAWIFLAPYLSALLSAQLHLGGGEPGLLCYLSAPGPEPLSHLVSSWQL